MKIRINNNLSFDEADSLIERYYDGLTTGTEEKQLQNFLSQTNLPERYKPEQAIFGYFEHKKQKIHFSIFPYTRWASIAAVIISVVFVAQLFFASDHSGYAYIDGKKITNVRDVKSQALASLSSISSSKNEMEEEFKNINNNELIKEQLNVFSGLEK